MAEREFVKNVLFKLVQPVVRRRDFTRILKKQTFFYLLKTILFWKYFAKVLV